MGESGQPAVPSDGLNAALDSGGEGFHGPPSLADDGIGSELGDDVAGDELLSDDGASSSSGDDIFSANKRPVRRDRRGAQQARHAANGRQEAAAQKGGETHAETIGGSSGGAGAAAKEAEFPGGAEEDGGGGASGGADAAEEGTAGGCNHLRGQTASAKSSRSFYRWKKGAHENMKEAHQRCQTPVQMQAVLFAMSPHGYWSVRGSKALTSDPAFKVLNEQLRSLASVVHEKKMVHAKIFRNNRDRRKAERAAGAGSTAQPAGDPTRKTGPPSKMLRGKARRIANSSAWNQKLSLALETIGPIEGSPFCEKTVCREQHVGHLEVAPCAALRIALGFPPGVPLVKNVGDLNTLEQAAFVTAYADLDELEPIHPEAARGSSAIPGDAEGQPPGSSTQGAAEKDPGPVGPVTVEAINTYNRANGVRVLTLPGPSILRRKVKPEVLANLAAGILKAGGHDEFKNRRGYDKFVIGKEGLDQGGVSPNTADEVRQRRQLIKHATKLLIKHYKQYIRPYIESRLGLTAADRLNATDSEEGDPDFGVSKQEWSAASWSSSDDSRHANAWEGARGKEGLQNESDPYWRWKQMEAPTAPNQAAARERGEDSPRRNERHEAAPEELRPQPSGGEREEGAGDRQAANPEVPRTQQEEVAEQQRPPNGSKTDSRGLGGQQGLDSGAPQAAGGGSGGHKDRDCEASPTDSNREGERESAGRNSPQTERAAGSIPRRRDGGGPQTRPGMAGEGGEGDGQQGGSREEPQTKPAWGTGEQRTNSEGLQTDRGVGDGQQKPSDEAPQTRLEEGRELGRDGLQGAGIEKTHTESEAGRSEQPGASERGLQTEPTREVGQKGAIPDEPETCKGQAEGYQPHRADCGEGEAPLHPPKACEQQHEGRRTSPGEGVGEPGVRGGGRPGAQPRKGLANRDEVGPELEERPELGAAKEGTGRKGPQKKAATGVTGQAADGDDEEGRDSRKRGRKDTEAFETVDLGGAPLDTGLKKRPRRQINRGDGHRLGLDARGGPATIKQTAGSPNVDDAPDQYFDGDVIDTLTGSITRGPAWHAHRKALYASINRGVRRKQRTGNRKSRKRFIVPDVARPEKGSSFELREGILLIKVPGSGWVPLQEASIVDMIHVSGVEDLCISPEGEGDVDKYRELMSNAAKAHFSKSASE